MATDPTLTNFAAATAKYRDGIMNLKFSPFEKLVTKNVLDISNILTKIKGVAAPQAIASAQQGADLLMATQRALDMRKMAPQDYRDAYNSAIPFHNRYEQVKAGRYEQGQL